MFFSLVNNIYFKFVLIFIFSYTVSFFFYNPDLLNYLDIYSQCYNSFFKTHYNDRFLLCSYMNIFQYLDFKYLSFLKFNIFFFSFLLTIFTKNIKGIDFIIVFPLVILFNFLYGNILISNGLSIILLFISFYIIKNNTISRLGISILAIYNHFTSIIFIMKFSFQYLFRIKIIILFFIIFLTLVFLDKFLTNYVISIWLQSNTNISRILIYDAYVVITFIHFLLISKDKFLKDNLFYQYDFKYFVLFSAGIIYLNFHYFFSSNVFGQLFIRTNHILFAFYFFSFLNLYEHYSVLKKNNIFKYYNFMFSSSYLHLLFMIRSFYA